jgi:hypothetical protein
MHLRRRVSAGDSLKLREMEGTGIYSIFEYTIKLLV